MTPKQLIKALSKLPPNKPVLISNNMGCPAYDYEGQRFVAGFDPKTRTISIESEVNDTKLPLL